MTEQPISCIRCAGGAPTRSNGRRSNDRTQARSRTALSTLALVLFIAQRSSRPAHSFSPSTISGSRQTARRASNFRRHFRHADDADDSVIADAAVSFLKFPSPSSASVRERMPTWLRQPRDHLAEENMAALRDAMTSTYLSESEAATVLSAIEDAANGDLNKAAGAAEFCQILVDTMEMDVDTLVAGAFHYCTCVTARERSALFPSAEFSLSSFWERHEVGHSGLEPYGVHAALIARDAARLKRNEAVAASVARGSDDADGSVNLRGLILSETRDWRALAIRSAACLYRLRGLLQARRGGGGGGRMTPEEVRTAHDALHIFSPLASRLGMHRLKNEIEGAAFRIKYRRQYRRVMSLALEKRRHQASEDEAEPSNVPLSESLKRVLDEVTGRVRDVIEKDPTFRKYADRVVVSARVKEPFSLWRKMLKTGAQYILDVPDALALRVVLSGRKLAPEEDDEVTRARERALCYYAQKMCVDRFEPLPSHGGAPGRFKDYIERPKRNGYQSLHYTARADWGGQEWPFEVQVRSEEMHRVAEYGFASHWSYKDYAKKNASKNGGGGSTRESVYRPDESLEAYLKSVQEWHWQRKQMQAVANSSSKVVAEAPIRPSSAQNSSRAERVRARAERIAPYIEALSVAKSDLTRESVFVFLSSSGSGKVLALPSGACVLDALREGERRFGVSLNWGNKSHGVEHNGVVSNVTRRLNNGDVVMIRHAGETMSM